MNQHDTEFAAYVLSGLRKRRDTPFQMANAKMSDIVFPSVKQEFPEVLLIKLGISQYFVVTVRARNALRRQLKAEKARLETEVRDLDAAIAMLSK